MSQSDRKDVEHLSVKSINEENQIDTTKMTYSNQNDEVLLNAVLLSEEHDDVKTVSSSDDIDYNIKYKDNNISIIKDGKYCSLLMV